MYLKSIEMQGFKSFPDRTKLVFDIGSVSAGESGITVIVGPNGSGKSNIADAMRWVLGEISSKSLRGTKMEDVIFGGADSRRPMGFAEVSVTFDNTSEFAKLDCPYDEVTVTRRYFRAGDSEYYINRKAVRLKDIYELFMNTGIGRDGYSIIGQGRIAEIISRKSDERRSTFEEASGIAKYRHMKTDAERKLENTESNMERVRDVFAEVESQLAPLEKEAEKAAKAIDLLDKKKVADVSLWLYDTERLRGDISVAEGAVKHSEFDLQTAEDALAALDVQSNKLYESSQNAKAETARVTSQIRECTEKNFGLDSEYRVLENNISHTHEMISAVERAKENSENSCEAAKTQLAEERQKAAELEKAVEIQRAEYNGVGAEIDKKTAEAAKLQDEIGRALTDLRAAEHEATDIKVRISALESVKNNSSDRTVGITEDIEKYTSEINTLNGKAAVVEKTIAKYKAELDGIAGEKKQAESKLTSANQNYGTAVEDLNSEKLRRDTVSQRINTYRAMEENFEGYAQAVKYIMSRYAEGKVTDFSGAPCGRIYGPLSKVISVGDNYVTAVETALGANLQHIVVEDEETAKAAIYCLKRGNAGRATFFPLTSMRAQSVTDDMRQASGYRGFISFADNLIECESKFRDVISSLLGRTLVFDNIDNATNMARALRYRVRVVTLDGQQINVGGSFTGGSVRTNGGILSRAGEIRRLEEELAERNKNVSSLEKNVSQVRSEIGELTGSIEDLNDRYGLIGVLMNTEKTQYDQIDARKNAVSSLIEKLKSDYDSIIEMSERYDADISDLHSEENVLDEKIKAINEVRTEKDTACADIASCIHELETKRTAILIGINNTEKDIETSGTLAAAAEERVRICTEEAEASDRRIGELKNALTEYGDAQISNRAGAAECQQTLSKLKIELTSLKQGSYESETKMAEIRERIRQKMSDKEVIFREYTINNNKLENLRGELDELAGKLWEEYSMTRNDALGLGYPPVTPETRDEIVKIQTDCRNKLRYLGHVDLGAADKFKEIKERYDYMSGQIADLEKSKADLTDIISKLDGEMRVAFSDAFVRINENFKQSFTNLFGGGSAELTLTEPDNVLESGIEIKAAPPGKIIKNLMQLSGGEQAFVAVALFFAILKVNPTPFCILDEIEAALDEVNVERLAQYIKKYTDGTQFILITHRRGTMAAATRLYGVTMPEHGISKVLMLDINDIAKKKEGDWDGIFG